MERKLAAILHAEVAGYSRFIAEDDAAALCFVTAYLGMLHTRVRQQGAEPWGPR